MLFTCGNEEQHIIVSNVAQLFTDYSLSPELFFTSSVMHLQRHPLPSPCAVRTYLTTYLPPVTCGHRWG